MRLAAAPEAPPALTAGLAGWSCQLGSDTLAGRERLAAAFRRCPAVAAPSAGSGVEVALAAGPHPRLRVTSRGAPLGLPEMLACPEWKRFVPVPGAGRRLFVDEPLAGGPALEVAGGEMLVLQPTRWPLYAFLGFLWLMQREAPVVSLHGAVAGVHGRAIVLLGSSGSGKSTLSWALHAAGADYYGDEMLFFRLPGYELDVLPRDVCLRPGGVAALGSAVAETTWYEVKPGDRKCTVSVPPPDRPCPRRSATLVFMDGFAPQPELLPMPGGEAARRLLAGMGYGDPSIGARLDVASDLIDRFPCRRLRVGPPDLTAAMLIEQARRDA